jgi:hypothetical protein
MSRAVRLFPLCLYGMSQGDVCKIIVNECTSHCYSGVLECGISLSDIIINVCYKMG